MNVKSWSPTPYIGNCCKATWGHQGCNLASKGISFDLHSSSSLATFAPLYSPKSRWQVSHESNICGIQKTGLFAPLSRCHFQSNFLCILRARSASDTDPSNFLQVEKHARSTSERWREGRCCPPFRNWVRRSMLLEGWRGITRNSARSF